MSAITNGSPMVWALGPRVFGDGHCLYCFSQFTLFFGLAIGPDLGFALSVGGSGL
jgi:hypothetical protein